MSETPLDRALALRAAAGDGPATDETERVKIVLFELAGECFAFPGEAVREILAACPVYFLPGCPPSLEGVIHVRGNIEPVIRLAESLRLPAERTQANGTILLLRGHGLGSGVRVDRVLDVTDVLRTALREAPDALPDTLRPFVRAVMGHAGQPVALLDPDALLAEHAGGLA